MVAGFTSYSSGDSLASICTSDNCKTYGVDNRGVSR